MGNRTDYHRSREEGLYGIDSNPDPAVPREKRLLAAVVYRAFSDLSHTNWLMRRHALNWFKDQRCRRPAECQRLDFLWICHELDLDPRPILAMAYREIEMRAGRRMRAAF